MTSRVAWTRELAKRIFDLVAAGVGLVALLPVFAAIALAIKLSSPGPVLFRQQRVGRNGRLFWLYKFRTMRPDPGGSLLTAAGDPRITPVGRWLRHRKLDELPQLWNVLRGDMSLVGPRPEVPTYVRLYSPEQHGVLSVRPGITGPTQVRFRREERLLAAHHDPEAYYVTTLMPAKLAIDLEYVRNRSLLGDVGLLLETLLALWRPTGEKSRSVSAGRFRDESGAVE